MIINGTTIRNPDWGDTVQSQNTNQNIHHARDETTRRIYKRTSELETVKFSVGYVDYDDAWTLFNAIKSNMHQQINITDWNSKTWTNCRILTNPWEITHVIKKCDDTDYGTEMYTLTLEFEGMP